MNGKTHPSRRAARLQPLETISTWAKRDPETLDPAMKVFDRQQEIVLDRYRTQCKPISGRKPVLKAATYV
jgi:hypothetical protein